jgi:hypothetical protein
MQNDPLSRAALLLGGRVVASHGRCRDLLGFSGSPFQHFLVRAVTEAPPWTEQTDFAQSAYINGGGGWAGSLGMRSVGCSSPPNG